MLSTLARPATRLARINNITSHRGFFGLFEGPTKKEKEVFDIYKQSLLPLEEAYDFHDFHAQPLTEADFSAKPMVMLMGQYSTGKTTFIRHLMEEDFPGIRIGPEPTTDRFIAIMHDEETGITPGNALVVDGKKQFGQLSRFGNSFLNRLQCSHVPNRLLEQMTLVDTPGVLSGEKQRIDRGYDFTGVLEWFAERVDRIVLLFDAHKLDVSDEFKRCIEALAGHEDKIRIVLNKADQVDHQQLMRVYGALMWSLGKLMKTPEVSRVYIGSFWDQPLHYDINRKLFQDEQSDLLAELRDLPRTSAIRKINDFIKRARLAKVHAHIIAHLHDEMPKLIGKEKRKGQLIDGLNEIFEHLQYEHKLSSGDFPDVCRMREQLERTDFDRFPKLKPHLLEEVDRMLKEEIAGLLSAVQSGDSTANRQFGNTAGVKHAPVREQADDTPFAVGKGEGFDRGRGEAGWVVESQRGLSDAAFRRLQPNEQGVMSGRAAKEHMQRSKLPNQMLAKIWRLSDVDADGSMCADEFALANYIIDLKLEGFELPSELPEHLIPPSKRQGGVKEEKEQEQEARQ